MEPIVRTEGVVSGPGQIRAVNLPFESGQKLEILAWPASAIQPQDRLSKKEIARRLAALEDLIEWNRSNLPKNLPTIPIEAMDRGSIYEDR